MSQCESPAAKLPAHVLIFPIPLQGHVNSMLNLAEILCISGLHITLLLFDHIHTRLLRHAHLRSRFSAYPGFRVATISDGLPPDYPRAGDRILDTIRSFREVGGSVFRHLMESTDALSQGGDRRRVSCLILDGALTFVNPVADELGIPHIVFRTVSACSFWSYFNVEAIIEAGELPLRGKDEDKLSYLKRKDMDFSVTSVPGMEGILRRRDLPAFCRVEEVNDPALNTMTLETKRTTESSGLILNTFEDLEGPVLDQIRKCFPNLYTIGPLHALLEARLGSVECSSSLWEEDRGCLAWLDSQPPKSVMYVSFGSITMLTRDELLEFLHGLVNSGKRFLWVVRPDSVVDGIDNNVETMMRELEEGAESKSRGLIVRWAPQREILAHPAVGAFFTHCGWNSTLEGIVVGVPMVCWPYFADQTTNSRFVSEVWKMGLDMKDRCDRNEVGKMVSDVMDVRRDEFVDKARGLSVLARKAISEGGSSCMDLVRLIEFIKSTVS